MSEHVSVAEILKLPFEERLQLVQEIWDSIAAVPEAVALTEEQAKELDARLEAHHRNPSEGSPWPEVKQRFMRH